MCYCIYIEMEEINKSKIYLIFLGGRLFLFSGNKKNITDKAFS